MMPPPRTASVHQPIRPSLMRQSIRPLRVLLVHELFPPDFAGGGEYIVSQIALHLHAIGHHVTVLTTGDPSLAQYQGIRTVRLPISRYRLNFAWRRIAELAKEADLIHAFTYHAIYPSIRAGRILKKPVVEGVLALFDGAWIEMRGTFSGRLWRRLERFLLSRPVDIKLHLSEFSLALSRTVGVAQPGDTVVVPGISQGQYYSHDDKPYVLYTGKLDPRKGIGVVLEVARRLPDVPFRIIGWGDQYGEVVAAASANVRVELRPPERSHYLEALAGARILLFPTRVETFGLVLPEAMAAGCAIVSTSPLEFEGVRIGQDDAAGAATAVQALWNDPVRCARAGAANQERARQYNWETHVDQLEAVYWRVIDAQRVRA